MNNNTNVFIKSMLPLEVAMILIDARLDSLTTREIFNTGIMDKISEFAFPVFDEQGNLTEVSDQQNDYYLEYGEGTCKATIHEKHKQGVSSVVTTKLGSGWSSRTEVAYPSSDNEPVAYVIDELSNGDLVLRSRYSEKDFYVFMRENGRPNRICYLNGNNFKFKVSNDGIITAIVSERLSIKTKSESGNCVVINVNDYDECRIYL